MRRMVCMAVLALVFVSSVGLAGEKIVLRVGNETGKTDSQSVGLQTMAMVVKEMSDGNLELDLYPGSVLGSGPAMVDMVKSGELDMYLGGAGFFAAWDGRLAVFDIPYLFSSAEQAHKILDSDFGSEMLAVLDPHGVKGLAFYENGIRMITNSVRPIRTPDDVKGLKLRVMPNNPVHVKIWTMFGAEPFPITFSEIYDSLKTKKVDGQEHPISNTYSGRFHEVQKHMSLTGHVYGPLILIMNKAKFDSLSPEYQRLLVKAARIGAQSQRKFIKDNEANFIAAMKDAGMEIIEVDAKPFRDLVRPTIEKDYIDKNGDAWLKKINDMAK